MPGLTSTQYTLSDLEGCTAYQVEIRSTCNGEQSDWSSALLFTTSDCGDCVDLAYCPTAGGTDDEFIQSVVVGGISNSSGDDGGYGNFTGQSTPMNIGQTYPITLTPGYNGFQYGEWFSVYMDFSGDGIFNISERVYNSTATTTAALTGDITIPLTALPGIVPARYHAYSHNRSGCEASFGLAKLRLFVLLTVIVCIDQLTGSHQRFCHDAESFVWQQQEMRVLPKHSEPVAKSGLSELCSTNACRTSASQGTIHSQWHFGY